MDLLIGDATKAREKLGWTPTCSFDELVRVMVLMDARKRIALTKSTRHTERVSRCMGRQYSEMVPGCAGAKETVSSAID